MAVSMRQRRWATPKATAKFNKELRLRLPGKSNALPVFDVRVYQYPSLALTAECFLWRRTDAWRNAVSMAAHAHYTPRELHGVNIERKLEMPAHKGVQFADYPTGFRYGTFLKRVRVLKELTPEELAGIPPERRPSGPVLRGQVVELTLPERLELSDIETLLIEQV